MFSLYLITDRRLVEDLPKAVERALDGVPRGAAAVQLREKDLGARALLELASRLAPICRKRGAPLLVNDRIDVALAARLDGVHLAGGSVGVEDARALLGDRLIGASCHDADQLSQRKGADFATFGPVFPTPGKGPAIGTEGLKPAARQLPLYALGGVDEANALACIEAGCRGIAAIRSWLAAPDPAEATARLLAAFDSTARGEATP